MQATARNFAFLLTQSMTAMDKEISSNGIDTNIKIAVETESCLSAPPAKASGAISISSERDAINLEMFIVMAA